MPLWLIADGGEACASQEEGDLDGAGDTVAQFLFGGAVIASIAGILWSY